MGLFRTRLLQLSKSSLSNNCKPHACATNGVLENWCSIWKKKKITLRWSFSFSCVSSIFNRLKKWVLKGNFVFFFVYYIDKILNLKLLKILNYYINGLLHQNYFIFKLIWKILFIILNGLSDWFHRNLISQFRNIIWLGKKLRRLHFITCRLPSLCITMSG